MYKIASIDIETLDTISSAVVLSIGCAVFNIADYETHDDITKDRVFHSVLELQGQLDKARNISADTLTWWMEKSKALQSHIFGKGLQRPVPEVLVELNQFLAEHKVQYILGNGNMFDNTILRSLYADYGLVYPVAYWGDIDLRTMKVMAGSSMEKVAFAKGVQHNAKDDAIHQAICAQKYFQHKSL